MANLNNGNSFNPETDRELYLFDDIDEKSVLNIIERIQAIEKFDIDIQNSQLDYFEEVLQKDVNLYGTIADVVPKYEPKPINLYINSNGGDAYSCMGLCSVIENCCTPINTIGIGMVASSGLAIFASGHYRYAYKNTCFLYHSVRGWNFGTLAERIDNLKIVERLQKEYDDIIMRGSILTREQLESYSMKRNMDYTFFGDEALDIMIVDELLDYEPELKTECDECEINCNCEDCECDA